MLLAHALVLTEYDRILWWYVGCWRTL